MSRNQLADQTKRRTATPPPHTAGVAPRLTVPVLDAQQWANPFGAVTLSAWLRDGVSFLAYNGWREDNGLTLIECPTSNRLRIVFAGVRAGWIEVPLNEFKNLLVLARQAYGPDYDITTVIHYPIQGVAS